MIVSNDPDLDLDEEDDRTDLPASPQDADLKEGGSDLDDMAPPQVDAVYRADAACEARV